MNYTIAIMDDVQGDIKINFDKDGNQYLVGLYNKSTKEYHHRHFKVLKDAYDTYEQLAKAIVLGDYNERDRIKILMGEKII